MDPFRTILVNLLSGVVCSLNMEPRLHFFAHRPQRIQASLISNKVSTSLLELDVWCDQIKFKWIQGVYKLLAGYKAIIHQYINDTYILIDNNTRVDKFDCQTVSSLVKLI